MNPTLYDILGVRRDASPEEIKRAWREAADRFEPGSGSAQFRLFNEAAEVLLDPQRRQEYDAGLNAEPAAREVVPAEPAPAPASTPDGSGVSAAVATAVVAPDAEAAPPVDALAAAEEETSGRARAGAPRWVMVAAGLLAVVLVAAAAWLGLRTWNVREVRRHSAVVTARTSATDTAERAAAVILSYDYKTLDADKKAAEHYMTASYAKQYAQTFEKLVRGNATRLHAHVAATVRASGVMAAEPDRANVLLFVDQTTVSTANGGAKQTALNRVEMKMVHRDGRWLVADITSY